ncbi:MAG TPA: DUF4232 domain-containing protein [Microlunatus sp.]
MIGSVLRGWSVRPLRLLGRALLRPHRRTLSLLGAGVLAFGLAGCGNGLKVAGPDDTPTPSVASGSPTRTATAKAGPQRRSPSARNTESDHQASASADSSAPDDDNGSDGPGSDGAGGADDSGGGSDPGSGSDDNSGSGGSGSDDVSTAPSTAPGRQTCRLADLRVGVRSPEGGGAAGSQYVLITFTNTSDGPCWMYGYAGVSFVGLQNGTQLGRPARRDRSTEPNRIKLSAGEEKTELLQIANAGNWDPEECVPTTADGFRIYPPDSYTAAYVPFEIEACQSKQVRQLTVYPVGAKA